MSPYVLQTKRLRLRPYRLEDVEPLFSVFGDPATMRYIGQGPDPTLDATRVRVERYLDHQRSHGFGLWVVEHRATGALLGDCGLLRLDGGPEIEVGYRLARDHWGQGFATEAAGACVTYGFDKLRLPRILAVTHPDNAASRRVLEKIGLRYQGFGSYYQRQVAVYRLTAEEFALARAAPAAVPT